MARKNIDGVATLEKSKVVRKGRHSKAHKKKKFARGQGKPLWENFVVARKSLGIV